MTVPNTLPIAIAHDCNANANASDEKGILFPSLSDTDIDSINANDDDLTMIVTTPSSITERPLLSPVDASSSNPKRAWYKQLKLPYAMLFISCVQVGLYAFLDDISTTKATHVLLFDPRRQRELWRFITYMLLHKDGVHLLQNVLLQCLFGIYLETFEGSWRILFVYVGGGIGGALGAAAMCSDLIVGASAGVYALLLSYVSHIILNYTTMKYKLHLIVSVSVIIISDIIYCAFHYFYNASPTISGGAHLFGALHGLLIGLILFALSKNYSENKNRAYHKIICSIAFISLVIIFIALVITDIKNTRLPSTSSRLKQKLLKREYSSE